MAHPEPSGHELQHIADADAQAEHDFEIAENILDECAHDVDGNATEPYKYNEDWAHQLIYKALDIGRKEGKHHAAPPTSPNAPSGWIPVSERLPESDGFYAVLVSEPDDIGWSWSADVWWRAEFRKEGDLDPSEFWRSCEPVEDGQPVTHWYELPPPPTTGERG